MRYILVCTAFVVFMAAQSFAQLSLKPSIGTFKEPQDSDSIATIVKYPSPDFELSGLFVGDTASEFSLYTLEGKKVSLSEILSDGKPVLLVTGSYTCPVFRYNFPMLNQVAAEYRSLLNIYVIYTVEAHPIIDKSPYAITGSQSDIYNLEEGIQYRQPRTYGQRKDIVTDMIHNFAISTNLLIDGPNNEYHTHFGPAPNNCYLIDPQGVVRFKEAWFDRSGSSILNDLNDFFKADTSSPRNVGIATFKMTASDTITAAPATTVELVGTLTNNTNSDAILTVKRVLNELPEGWTSAICTDICLDARIDSTTIRVPANSTKTLSVFFYIGSETGTGNVQLQISNFNVAENESIIDFHCVAVASQSVGDQSPSSISTTISPNPVTKEFKINSDRTYTSIRIIDLLGKTVKELPSQQTYSLADLVTGVYRLQLLSSDRSIVSELSLIKQ